ncbi:MAG: DUF4147 domain-containing protein [Patescibacteria group bacterium]
MEQHRIRNFHQLATTPQRAALLEIIEAGFDAIDSQKILHAAIQLQNSLMTIDGVTIDLDSYTNVYILGFGKGACRAVFELQQTLQSWVTDSVVIDQSIFPCDPVRAYQGSHPMPSEANIEATAEILALAEKADENDLVFVVVAGGGSSLLCSDTTELSYGETLFKEFVKAGADIKEMNIVRQHLSKIKGGGLAKILYPATTLGLIFSDIVGGHPEEVASGPTYYDSSTIEDARKIIERYHPSGSYDLVETPKDPHIFEKIRNVVVVSNEKSLQAMSEVARAYGFIPQILNQPIYDEPTETLSRIFGIAKPGTVVFGGGEVRLRVTSKDGKGGRCSFLALEALSKLGKSQCFAAVASDGLDNGDRAGSIIDEHTHENIKKAGIDVEEYKKKFDAYTVFEELGSNVNTGITQANVSDWYILLTDHQ